MKRIGGKDVELNHVRAMIVDDTAFMRMMMRGLLEEMGIQVVAEARNGKEAVELFPKLIPDLITMDITMPELDGVEALKQIISIDASARVIMCSAMGQRGFVLDALRCGAKDFIVKPFEKERVREAIWKTLRPGVGAKA
jgi:two-component system chemotaxis response regulator CheY